MSESREPLPPAADGSEVERAGARPLIGVGASAAGLDALTRLTGALPPGLDGTAGIGQHRSPTAPSMRLQLIARKTDSPLQALDDGAPRLGQLHIALRAWNSHFRENGFSLKALHARLRPCPSVNCVSTSLAEARRKGAVGALLSGAGGDRRIFAQDPTIPAPFTGQSDWQRINRLLGEAERATRMG